MLNENRPTICAELEWWLTGVNGQTIRERERESRTAPRRRFENQLYHHEDYPWLPNQSELTRNFYHETIKSDASSEKSIQDCALRFVPRNRYKVSLENK